MTQHVAGAPCTFHGSGRSAAGRLRALQAQQPRTPTAGHPARSFTVSPQPSGRTPVSRYSAFRPLRTVLMLMAATSHGDTKNTGCWRGGEERAGEPIMGYAGSVMATMHDAQFNASPWQGTRHGECMCFCCVRCCSPLLLTTGLVGYACCSAPPSPPVSTTTPPHHRYSCCCCCCWYLLLLLLPTLSHCRSC